MRKRRSRRRRRKRSKPSSPSPVWKLSTPCCILTLYSKTLLLQLLDCHLLRKTILILGGIGVVFGDVLISLLLSFIPVILRCNKIAINNRIRTSTSLFLDR